MHTLLSLENIAPGGEEFVETLLRGKGVRIERIVSHGHVTPEDSWYDQTEDEWALVLQGNARLLFEDGREMALAAGDHVLLKAHQKHRVSYTSSPCIWLTVFAQELKARKQSEGRRCGEDKTIVWQHVFTKPFIVPSSINTNGTANIDMNAALPGSSRRANTSQEVQFTCLTRFPVRRQRTKPQI